MSSVIVNVEAATCAVMDDTSHRISLSAHRIISLAPDVTETLFAIGAGNRIVGTIKGSDYPLAARQLPVIGSYTGIDLERVFSLHPDLVIVWGNGFGRQLEIIKQKGIAIYHTEPRALEDVPATMRKLGCLTGQSAKANQQAALFENRLSRLSAKYQHQPPVTVFYQIGAYSLLTINRSSWINQVITLCGGRNVFANALSAVPEVSWEAVLAANPQVILSDASGSGWKGAWQHFSMLAAVKAGRLYTVHPDWIDRAGPRLIDGAAEVCGYLQNVRGSG